MVGKARNSGD